MTTAETKPFWRRPLPPIKRPGETAVTTAVEPQDVAVVELPPETAAMGDGARASDEVSAPPLEVRPAAQIAPHDAVRNAAHNLDVARWRARQCRDAVAASREAFSSALADWNRTMPVQTQQQAHQDYVDTNQRERAARAAQGLLRRPMTISETAKAMSGGNMRPGGGRSFNRGAFTRAEAKKIEMNRAAAQRMNGSLAPRTKLPSER